eukprot:CAMPEP_0118991144 /NCGR_PEP_ID=MMETSP1173-20130426/51138_1 /TAXON_ID=1034831 /ORGANISM="Rhizochromulina marina cf, Strain CCMP1243" /LENGTH=39 /DNA_ID= /DNA_START= /DNA_END= /DNA_ORIENTATION=
MEKEGGGVIEWSDLGPLVARRGELFTLPGLQPCSGSASW